MLGFKLLLIISLCFLMKFLMWPGLFFCPDSLLSLYNLIAISIRTLPKNGEFMKEVLVLMDKRF